MAKTILGYYMSPPQQPPNAFAAFWTGFLQTRSPWVMRVFEERLKALDPTLRDELISDLEKQRMEALKQYALNQREAERIAAELQLSRNGMMNERTRLEAAKYQAKSAVAVAGTQQQTELAKNLQVRSELGKDLRSRAQQLITEAAGDPENAGRILKSRLEQLDQEAADGLDGLERAALASEVERMVAPEALGINDEDLVDAIRQTVTGAFGPSAEFNPRTFGVDGDSFDTMAEDVYRAEQLLGGEGGASTSSSTSTSRGGTAAPAPQTTAPSGDGSASSSPAATGRGSTPPTPQAQGSDPLLTYADDLARKIEELRAGEGQFGPLGGFFDPLPGAGGGRRAPAPRAIPSVVRSRVPVERPEATSSPRGPGLVDRAIGNVQGMMLNPALRMLGGDDAGLEGLIAPAGGTPAPRKRELAGEGGGLSAQAQANVDRMAEAAKKTRKALEQRDRRGRPDEAQTRKVNTPDQDRAILDNQRRLQDQSVYDNTLGNMNARVSDPSKFSVNAVDRNTYKPGQMISKYAELLQPGADLGYPEADMAIQLGDGQVMSAMTPDQLKKLAARLQAENAKLKAASEPATE
jgi:hypothetical protein